MSKSTGKTIWLIAATMAVGFALLASSLAFWIGWIGRHPSDRAVRTHIASLTSEPLPHGAEVLFAWRSTPTLNGDRYGCYLVQLPATEFEEYASRFPATENPNILGGCPSGTELLNAFDGEFRAQLGEDPNPVLLHVDEGKNQVLIRYFSF